MAANSHSESHYGPEMWVFPVASQVTREVSERTSAIPMAFGIGLGVSGLLLGLGIIGFVIRAMSDGFGAHGPWGYYAAIFSFIFMVTGAAPLAASIFRVTKSHWRRPLTRVSELFSLIGIFNILLFIPLMFVLPAFRNPNLVPLAENELDLRRTIWFEVPIGATAPQWLDLLGIACLALCALVLLWLSAVPDMAQARLQATGFRRRFYGVLAGHWHGTKSQWINQKAGLALLGAFYFMLLVFMQFTISSDYAQSLIPGWKDSIFPVIYTLTGFQSSLGLMLVILFVLRRWGGYKGYIGISLFWSASKILLGLTLLWVYHMFAFGITYWYGRLEVEQNILKYLLFQSYGWLFLANLIFSFFLPFLTLLWNPVRRSDWGPALAGACVLIGAFLFSWRIFVGAFNAGDVYNIGLEHVPAFAGPDLWDVLIVLGGLGGAVFIYLLGSRLIPTMCAWEIKEGAMYQHMGTFMRGRYLVLAKPE